MFSVGIDFQMKTLTLDSTSITLQLWDTAGQERSDITERILMFTSHVESYLPPEHSSFCEVIFLNPFLPIPLFFRFRSITEQYYRKADSVLAMYDVTHSPSFTAVRGWMDSVKVNRWRCQAWLDVKARGKNKHADYLQYISNNRSFR